MTQIPKQTNEVLDMVFSPDSEQLVIIKSDKTIQVWNIAKKTMLTTFKNCIPHIKKITFSLDSRKIAFATTFNEVEVWELDKKKRLATLRGLGGSTNIVLLPLVTIPSWQLMAESEFQFGM